MDSTSAAPLPRLVLRADGNPRIGLGHVMRLLALADLLRADFRTVFVVQEPAAELRQTLAAGVDEVVEMTPQPAAGEPAWLAQNVLRAGDLLVLDGYGFEHSYQQAVRPHVGRLVCLDDLHAWPSAADLLINPAGGVQATDYDLRQPGARLLTGPAYAPLRPAFMAAAAQAAQADEQPMAASPERVLICLGGADPGQQTQRVAEALLALARVEQVHAVVGSAYAAWESLQQWAADHPRLTLHRHLSAADMCAVMQHCGAAVCAPSTVSYEYCAAGGGLLFTQPLADNQRGIDHFLREQGLALPYHSAANVLTSPEAHRVAERLRRAQRQHFDGQTGARLRQAFAELLNSTSTGRTLDAHEPEAGALPGAATAANAASGAAAASGHHGAGNAPAANGRFSPAPDAASPPQATAGAVAGAPPAASTADAAPGAAFDHVADATPAADITAADATSPPPLTAAGLGIRRAAAGDARLYFDWANDPAVRQNAVQTEPIAWETHVGWFSRRLADADAYLYVLEQDGTPVGQVRVEFEAASDAPGIIDYSVAPAWRGRGLGAAVLGRALTQLRRDRPGAWSVVGQVKPHNRASARVFERLGFRREPVAWLHGQAYDVFLWSAAPVGPAH